MGLFSFAADAGKQLKSLITGAEAPPPAAADATPSPAAPGADPAWVATQLKAALVGLNLGVEGLEVQVDGGTAVLIGSAPTQKAKELAVLVVGNVAGITAVDDRIEVVIVEPPAVFHTVVKGDTLSKIAGAHYGVMRMYDVIFEANTPMLRHPDEIFPGQVLRLPPVEAPTHTVAKGETLGVIAKHWYGDAQRYKDIFAANQGTLTSPDHIQVGQQLVIPLRQA